MYEIKHSAEHSLPYVEQGGHRRILAALPRRQTYGARRFRDVYGVIPRSSWQEVDFSAVVPHWILDQDGTGSCVGHGSCTAFTYGWLLGGATPQEFSACFLYGLINGGSDNGAVVGDALQALKTTGICLLSQVPEGKIYKRDFPQDAFTTAARFKISDAVDCPSFDEIGSALMMRRPVSFGVEIGQAFEPDGSGVIPDQRGGGGGHCMCAMGLKQINGKWHLKVQNSWGEKWGLQGFCYMPESYFQGGDNWAVEFAAEDPQEENVPPAAS